MYLVGGSVVGSYSTLFLMYLTGEGGVGFYCTSFLMYLTGVSGMGFYCTLFLMYLTGVGGMGFLKFLLDTCPFVGPLIPLFWTSGDISSGFQNHSGFCLIQTLQRCM